MKKISLIVLSFIVIYILSSCNFDSKKADQYIQIPWGKDYDSYEEMLKDYKEYNPNYEDIYLDPFEELNPAYYSIEGECYCEIKKHKDGKCPNLKYAHPGIGVKEEKMSGDTKYNSVYEIWLFEKVEIDDVSKIQHGDDFPRIEKYNYIYRTGIADDYFIYYEDKIIFTLSFQSLSPEEKETIINNIINHIKTKYINS